MPKARLVFDGDNVYIGKDARIYWLKDDIASKIDEIPWVINSLDSTSTTDALSANMGRTLQDQINWLSWTWKFLSTWDCTTWLPGTNPQEDPYTYKVWDYYVVSVVGSTNYKPHWSTYTQWVPSTTVELENVWVNDKYYFDWADWVRIPDTAIQISIDTALSTTSTNAVENRAIATAINAKQDTISDLSTIRTWASKWATAIQPNDNISQLTNNVGYQTAGDVAAAIVWKQDVLTAWDWISLTNNIVTNTKPGAAVSSTAPSNPTEWLLWYDTVNDVLKSYDWSNWNEVGSDAADINTKTFYLSSTSDLTNAQTALDWYLSWKNPIIVLDDKRYFIWYKSNSSLWFFNWDYSQRTNYWNSTSWLIREWVIITYSDNTVTEIRNWWIWNNINSYLTTWYNYSNPYIPEYDGSPATKKYVDDSVADVIPSWGTAPQNPQEWDLWYDTVNHVLKIYNWTTWETVDTDSDTTYTAWNGINIDANNEISVDTTIIPTQADLAWKQDVLTAWDNIQISAQNVISATDTTYTAWEWIAILNWNDYSAMQWPAPDGFHVPLTTEWKDVYDIWTALGGWSTDWTNFGIALKLPFAGRRFYHNASKDDEDVAGYYWTSTAYDTTKGGYLEIDSSTINCQMINIQSFWHSVRAFKDEPVIPTSSWTKLYWTSIEAGWIFWNSTDWLISLSSDWQTWITIQDKNLWATTARNDGDYLSHSNCWYIYQWWNNYWFLWQWNIITDNVKVDTTWYWPWNYYSSSTFVTVSSWSWSSVRNDDLWWWATWVVTLHNAITSIQLSDAAFSASWDWDTTHAPSKNAIYDVLGDVETLLANL